MKTGVGISWEEISTGNEKMGGSSEEEWNEERPKATFKEAFMGKKEDEIMVDSVEDEDDFASDENEVDEDGNKPWFSVRMTRAVKAEVHRSWRLSIGPGD